MSYPTPVTSSMTMFTDRGRRDRWMGVSVRSRRGTGVLLGLVMLILTLLGLVGIGAFFQSSGTGRTHSRVVGVRSALEAGDSAIAEAVIYLRRSLDTGWTASECPDNWRSSLCSVMQQNAPWPRDKTVVPKSCQLLYASIAGAFRVDNVKVDLVDFFNPRVTGSGPPPIEPPQGVLQLSVGVSASGRVVPIRKIIRQRWSFYVTFTRRSPTVGSQTPVTDAAFTLLLHPLATVIE